MASIKAKGCMTKEQAREYYIGIIKDGMMHDGVVEVEFPDGILHVDGVKNRMGFLTFEELYEIRQYWRECEGWFPGANLFEILDWEGTSETRIAEMYITAAQNVEKGA